jgi:CSLREA domain-containing protein
MAKRQRRRRQERRKEHAGREGWTTRQSVITGAGLVASGVLGVAQPALADSFTVNAGGDGGDGTCQDVATGDCTLRDAIYSANGDADNSYISFASNVTGTITLNAALPVVYGTYVYGPGPDKLTISGDDNSGIFNAYMVNPGYPLHIEGLTLTHGSQPFGAAIYDENARLSVYDSVLTGNNAFAGGAIYEAGGYDGGYDTNITFSTLSGNSANYGGAVWANYFFGLVGATTFQGNSSKYGGAIDSPKPVGFFNGFVYDSTISGNSASESGGGMYVYATYLTNTILANNTGTNPDLVGLAYVGALNSLIRDPGTTVINGSNNLTGQDPQLSALGNNGGNTPTMRPAASSPVADAGYSLAPIDQRGSQRPFDLPTVANTNNGNAADIGAVELTAAEAAPPSSPPPPAVVPPKKKKKCKKHKKKHHSAVAAKKKKCKKKKKKHAAQTTSERAISAWRAEIRRNSGSRAWGDQAWRTRG